MEPSDYAVIGSVLVSAMGAIFGLYQARKADRSASTTKTIEIGVKDLVDQYQEANKELRAETSECKQQCEALRAEVTQLRGEVADYRRKVSNFDTIIDNKDAEIIRLKLAVGEPIE